MIGKTIKGGDFGGVLRYLLSREKREKESARIIAGTVSGRTIKQLTAEFSAIRRLKPALKKVVYHQMLRPPSEEGASLTNETWSQIAEVHARSMGYSAGQWVAVRHHDHTHIIANRVLPDGRVVSDSHDWARAEKSVRRIEKHFGLTEVESSHLLEPERAREHERAPTQAEKALADKGEPSVRELLQDQVLAILRPELSLTEFIERLYERGVLVRPNIQSTGRLAGMSFVLQSRPGIAFAGSSLGRRFSLGNLKAAGLSYDPDRDRVAVEQSLERCAAVESSPTTSQGRSTEPLRPLVDPKAARQHLEAIAVPVVLAARDKTGHIKELGTVDGRSIGAQRRRLRRRCALGQEILVRPAPGAAVFVIPRCTAGDSATLESFGITPFLVVESTWNRQDFWVRTGGGGNPAPMLRAGLRELGVGTDHHEPEWGSLAGYRPDPMSMGTSTAVHIKNRIALVTDAIVDVSLELLERIRQLVERRKRREASVDTTPRGDKTPKGKGRSR